MTTSKTPRTDSVWHGYLPTPVRDVRYEESKNLERELTAAKESIAKLNDRLENNHYFDKDGNRHECEPGEFPDGISCRDETIELFKERNKELETSLACARAVTISEVKAALTQLFANEISKQSIIDNDILALANKGHQHILSIVESIAHKPIAATQVKSDPAGQVAEAVVPQPGQPATCPKCGSTKISPTVNGVFQCSICRVSWNAIPADKCPECGSHERHNRDVHLHEGKDGSIYPYKCTNPWHDTPTDSGPAASVPADGITAARKP